MKRRIPYLAVVLGLCLAFATPAPAQQGMSQSIHAPFGLRWGERDTRLAQLISGANAKIVEKKTVGQRQVWVVEGLVQTNLKRTLFYFKDGGLDEVELQYQSDDWVESHYSDFLGQLRQKVEKRFGPGRLLVRSKTPIGDVTQTIVGYAWAKGESQLEIIYFSAESPTQTYRTVSLHYKAL